MNTKLVTNMFIELVLQQNVVYLQSCGKYGHSLCAQCSSIFLLLFVAVWEMSLVVQVVQVLTCEQKHRE